MLVGIDHKFDELFPLCLGESPSQSLQSGAYLDLFLSVHKVFLDVLEVQGGQLLLLLLHILELLLLNVLHLGHRTAHGLDDAAAVEALIHNALHGADLLLEGVVHLTAHHLLAAALHLLLILLHRLVGVAHLCLDCLDETGFIHVDTVLTLDLVCVVQKELLIPGEFLLDGLHRDFVDRLPDLEGIHGMKEFFGYIKDVSGE